MKLDQIEIPKGRRKANPDRVKEIAASIEEVGLLTPIQVVRIGLSSQPGSNEYSGELRKQMKSGEDKYRLAAGLHRLEAFKSLGEDYENIKVEICHEDDAELIEIDENLCREELTPAERATYTTRKIDIMKERAKERKEEEKAAMEYRKKWEELEAAELAEQHSVKSGPGRPVDTGTTQAVADIAKKTGKTERHVYKDLGRGKKIAPDVMEAIKGTPADTGVNLDALAGMTHDDQRQAHERVSSGIDKNYREARDFIRGDVAEKIDQPRDAETVKTYKALSRDWTKATDAARANFLDLIEQAGRVKFPKPGKGRKRQHFGDTDRLYKAVLAKMVDDEWEDRYFIDWFEDVLPRMRVDAKAEIEENKRCEAAQDGFPIVTEYENAIWWKTYLVAESKTDADAAKAEARHKAMDALFIDDHQAIDKKVEASLKAEIDKIHRESSPTHLAYVAWRKRINLKVDAGTATKDEIEIARKKMVSSHPDWGGSNEDFIKAKLEYDHVKKAAGA